MQSPVSTIDEAYKVCNPEQPLKNMDDPRYVDLTEVRGINGGSVISTSGSDKKKISPAGRNDKSIND